jgi:hypothetical protein
MTMSEKVSVGFTAPGSVWVEVDDPEDVEQVMDAFVSRIEEMNTDELVEKIETDGKWLAENVHFVDSTDGDIIHQW